jgi:hypothetical protein
MCTAAIGVLIVFTTAINVSAYSVLAHEALIDAAWAKQIEPILRAKYPRVTPDELTAAKGYAYGGAAVQDIGYYPFGTHFVSDLMHYVRSGEFVEILLRDARDVNEYAFALGALAHYVGDNAGHPEAINRAVPIIFPKLRARYGSRVEYAQAPAQHVITEFSLDVVEAAAARYGPEAYMRFVAFNLSKPLLERAVRDTYGVELKDVFGDFDLAVGTYRFSISQMIPSITQAAWKEKHDEVVALIPGVEERTFVFRYPPAKYAQQYGTVYRRPGWMARFLSFLYRLLPKIGPLKPLSFAAPTTETERLFTSSLTDAEHRFLARLEEVRRGTLHLPNTNFDNGQASAHGRYRLADETYARLLHELANTKFEGMTAALRANITQYYGDAPRPSREVKDERKHWDRVRNELSQLSNKTVASR